jgi:hypothetical protein
MASVYQLKVTLVGTQPAVWRRIQVRSAKTMGQLHDILQIVMGWTNSHLHQFIVRGVTYADLEFDPYGELDFQDEQMIRLNDAIKNEGDHFVYEYDFGDSWQHDVVVEQIVESTPGTRYPTCLSGARACPPEDCGGVGGFEGFLVAIRDRSHPEHTSYLEWVGGAYDPEAFDVEEINRHLKR